MSTSTLSQAQVYSESDPRFVRSRSHELFGRVVNGVLARGLPTAPEPPPGWIAIDPHVHSRFSGCSVSWPEKMVSRAAEMGLSAMAVVDHNDVRGARWATLCADRLKAEGLIPEGFLVIPGAEISTTLGHVVGLFLDEDIPSCLSPEETVRRIHDIGGIAVAVHPCHSSGVGEAVFDAPFDAVEVESGVTFSRRTMERSRVLLSDARLAHLGRLGSSDAHYVNAIGNCYTLVQTEELSLEGIKSAIVAGRATATVSRTCQRLRKLLGWAAPKQ